MSLSFESAGWEWGAAEREPATFRRRMSTVAPAAPRAALADVELIDGWIELELAVGPERAFHGIVWRAADDRNYESFFVRPHQVGNPDAVQYTPVTNGISSWQLYHGDGLWAPVASPDRGVVSDPGRVRRRPRRGAGRRPLPVALVCPLKRPARAGRIGVLVGGPDVYLGELTFGEDVEIDRRLRPAAALPPGVLRAWEVSDAFAKSRIDGSGNRAPFVDADRERAGRLLDLSRLQGSTATGTPCSRGRPSCSASRGTGAPARVQRPCARVSERSADLPRRRHVPVPRLPLPGKHRLVRHALPPSERRRQRARRRGVGGLSAGWGVQARVVD